MRIETHSSTKSSVSPATTIPQPFCCPSIMLNYEFWKTGHGNQTSYQFSDTLLVLIILIKVLDPQVLAKSSAAQFSENGQLKTWNAEPDSPLQVCAKRSVFLQVPAKKPFSQTPANSQMCGFKTTQQLLEKLWDLFLQIKQPENMVLPRGVKRTPKVGWVELLRPFIFQTLKVE